MFVGRERERARIDRLLQDARTGRSGALLLHGEAGIGKTALMRWAIGQATGMRVLRARGIETESDIPFAGLAELVTPLLDRLDDVPEVQARALRGALALGPATKLPALQLSAVGMPEADAIVIEQVARMERQVMPRQTIGSRDDMSNYRRPDLHAHHVLFDEIAEHLLTRAVRDAQQVEEALVRCAVDR